VPEPLPGRRAQPMPARERRRAARRAPVQPAQARLLVLVLVEGQEPARALAPEPELAPELE